MNLIDNGTDDVEYENIHYTILDGIISNMSLVISKGNVCSIDDEDSYCNGYYTILFSSSPYMLQGNLNVDGIFFLSDECF